MLRKLRVGRRVETVKAKAIGQCLQIGVALAAHPEARYSSNCAANDKNQNEHQLQKPEVMMDIHQHSYDAAPLRRQFR